MPPIKPENNNAQTPIATFFLFLIVNTKANVPNTNAYAIEIKLTIGIRFSGFRYSV